MNEEEQARNARREKVRRDIAAAQRRQNRRQAVYGGLSYWQRVCLGVAFVAALWAALSVIGYGYASLVDPSLEPRWLLGYAPAGLLALIFLASIFLVLCIAVGALWFVTLIFSEIGESFAVCVAKRRRARRVRAKRLQRAG